MQRLIAYYRLSRPLNALSGALAVIVGGYVAFTGAWANILLAAVVTFLVTASSNAWNDYLDVEIDRINQPQRVLPAGHLPTTHALGFSLTLAAISLALAALINLPAFLLVVGTNIALYIYSWRLKSTVLVGNATVALVSAASAVFGGVAAGNVGPSFWLALVIATVIMAREILKTMADYEGDLAHQVKTVATVWGPKVAYALFLLILLASIVVLLLPMMSQQIGWKYAAVIVIGIYPVLFYVMMKVRPDSAAHQLERMSQLLKYDFLVWFAAIFIGTY